MARPVYDDAFKDRAVALAVEHGAAEAARLTNVNAGTIRSWMSRTPGVATDVRQTIADARTVAADRRGVKREELRTLLIEKAVDMLGRMDEAHIDFKGKDAKTVTFPKAPSGACQQYATAAAILLDKFRLEMGEATGRVERSEPVRAAEEVLDELEQRRRAA